MNENGKEYVEIGSKPHACIPRKIDQKNQDFIQNSSYDSISKKILSSGYEMTTTKNGNSSIKIFASDSKCHYYLYYYLSREKHYYCSNCKGQGRTVTVKLRSNDGEEYIQVGAKTHLCKPLKYEKVYDKEFFNNSSFNSISRIIHQSGYDTITSNKGNINLKVYTSDEKTHFYAYHYVKKSDSYRCSDCQRLGKTIMAKFDKDENGKECIKLGEILHICNPRI